MINLDPEINPFAALPNIITQSEKKCSQHPPEYLYERMEESGLTISQNVELQETDPGKGSCSTLLDARSDMGKTELFLNKEIARKQKLTQQDHDYGTNTWDHDYLTYSDLQFMNSFQKDVLPIAQIESKFKWVRYHPNRAEPRQSTIS